LYFELNKTKKDMKAINAYAAYDAETPLKPLHLKEKSLVKEVQIEILYSGVCHSDIHTVKGDWGPAIYPLVPDMKLLVKLPQ
jgi:uncharacterized zinc-type alcohol dehydrogenase-like protein